MIEIALVGCGYWGKNYVKTLGDLDRFKLGYVIDTKAPSVKIPEGIKIMSSLDMMLSDSGVRGVIVATPTITHYDIASKALNAGKHVLVEKPITTNSKKARELANLAKQRGITLMVGHIFEYNNAVQEIKKRIDMGEIGQLRYIESRRVGLGPVRQDVSVLWDFATHDIYISNLFTGKKPQAVSCSGISHNGVLNDIIVLTLRYNNPGVLSTIYANWEHPVKERQTIIGGSKKAILFNDMEPSEKIRIFDRCVDYNQLLNGSGGIGEFQTITREGDTLIPRLKLRSPLENQLLHFAECINGTSVCRTDGEKGLTVVQILEAAEESMKNKSQEVSLK